MSATDLPSGGPDDPAGDKPAGAEASPPTPAIGARPPAAATAGWAPETGTMSPAVPHALRTRFAMRRRDPHDLQKPIGELLIEHGSLNREQLEETLRVQAVATKRGERKRFGAIARELGFVDGQSVDQALARQFDLPSLVSADPRFAPELLAARDSNHPMADALRGVRDRIAQTWLDARRPGKAPGDAPRSGGHAVAVVSVQRGDGRSFIAANLAITFAQCGRRTLLIDADLRQPRQHQLFQVDDRVGLSTLLVGRSGTESATRVSGMRDLYVMPAGPIPPNAPDLLARPEFGWLLWNAEERFDVVLVDTPAWSNGSDAENICRQTRAAALVVRADQTATRKAQDFIAVLREARAQVLGLVFNR